MKQEGGCSYWTMDFIPKMALDILWILTTWTDGPGKLSPEGVLKVVGGATWREVDSANLDELRMPNMSKDAW